MHTVDVVIAESTSSVIPNRWVGRKLTYAVPVNWRPEVCAPGQLVRVPVDGVTYFAHVVGPGPLYVPGMGTILRVATPREVGHLKPDYIVDDDFNT